MMPRMAAIAAACSLAALPAGCASPPSHLYTLSHSATAATKPNETSSNVSVVVGPVSIPSVVDLPQIAVSNGPNQVSLDEPLTDGEDPIFREIEDWGPSPEKKFAQTELNEILTQVIGELEPIFRVVCLLRDVEGISTEETAQILGISVPAVKSRLLRARLKLRQRLNKHFRRSETQ